MLEGADGSGKSTQFRLLAERLRAVGYEVEVFKFPQYEQASSHFIKNYLNGVYGPAANINPYTASLFYALDRYEAAPKIRQALNSGKIVLADRFVGSNMAHQGSKFTNAGEQRGFFIWDDGLEFQLLGIPRPTINLFLRVPAKISRQLMQKEQRKNRGYTESTHDEHEKDSEHLNRTVETYDTLCKLFPKDFQAIECTEDNKLLNIASINDKIWNKLKPLLPPKPPNIARDVVIQLEENPKQYSKEIEARGAPFQDTTAAVLNTKTKNRNNSVIGINKVSLLALGYIQGSGLEVNITSVVWPHNERYDYYTLAGLSKKTAQEYSKSMVKMAGLHKQMAERVQNNKDSLQKALKAVGPVAALASANISGPSERINRLAHNLQMNPLEEVRWLAKQLLASEQKAANKEFKASYSNIAAIKNDQLNEVIAKLLPEHLPQNLPAHSEEVSLLEVYPRNEFSLLIDSIYPYSTLSRNEIAADLERWPYEQKKEALKAAFAQEAAPVLQQARYLWSVICDRPTFEQLAAAVKAEEVQVQPASPRYGYDVPEVIEEDGIDEIYVECFDESLKLFSSLQASGYENIAPYATLLGHKNRWQFATTASALKEAGVQASQNALEGLLSQMREKVAEHHPLVADNISIRIPKESKSAPLIHQKPQKSPRAADRRKRRARRSKK